MSEITFADIGRYLKFYKQIQEAEEVLPDNDFISSCKTYLNQKGYLTEKQFQALENIIQNTGYLECTEGDLY